MVDSAHARAVALDSTCMLAMFLSYFTSSYMIHVDAAVEYSPLNIAQTLNQINNRLENISNRVQDIDERTEGMDERMTAMDETLRIGLAHTANLRIVNRNTRLQSPNMLEPLQKTVRHSDTTSFNY
jgi:hypothetical protein